MKPFFILLIVWIAAQGCARQEFHRKVVTLEEKQSKVDSDLQAMQDRIALLQQKNEERISQILNSRADANLDIGEIRRQVQQQGGQQEINVHRLRELDDEVKALEKKIAEFSAQQAVFLPLQERLSALEQTCLLLSQRLEAAASTPPSALAAAPVSGKDTSSAVSLPSPEDSYERGKSEYQQSQFAQAIRSFQAALKGAATPEVAADAQFLIAEAYFKLGKYAVAIAEFQKLIEAHPKSDLACTAGLRQGLSFVAMEEYKEARIFLQDVLAKCPQRQEERALATRELKRIESLLAKRPKGKTQ